MTPNRITAQIAEQAKRQFDTPFRLMLGDRIKWLRSTLIRQTLQAHPLEVNAFQQSINMEMVPLEFTCNGVGCKGSITRLSVPELLRFNNQLFQFVGSVDGSNSFRMVEAGQYTFMKHSRFPATYFEFVNNRIRTFEQVGKIRIDGVFDDTEAASLLQCSFERNTQCDWWNEPFKANGDIIEKIIEILVREFRQDTSQNVEADYEK